MPKTLVTGANSSIAAHIIDQLINLGHQVTGSVRTTRKGEQILTYYPEYAGKFTYVVIPDIAADGAWDETFKAEQFDYVIHTAAPVLSNPENVDFNTHFLKPSLQGNEQLLKAAHTYNKSSLKAISVTGSINSVTDGSDVNTRILSSDDWLPLTVDDAIAVQQAFRSYCVAKAESEKAIWRFVEKEKPAFSITVLLPSLIIGPPILPIANLKELNWSTQIIYDLWNGNNEFVPPTPFPSYLDARSLATAHINALTAPEAANKRALTGGQHYSHQFAVDVLRKSGIKEVQAGLVKDKEYPERRIKWADVDKWNAILGIELKSAEETFGDTARKILDLEKKFGKSG